MELIALRTASREVDYRQRICEDAVKFATADKTGALPKFQRNLKKAQNQVAAALELCKASGIEVAPADLPRALAAAETPVEAAAN